jgi:arginyl-tRNA synthetase
MTDLFARIRQEIGRAVRATVDAPPDQIPVETPPNPEMGDLATPVALGLAKVLRRKPRDIAEQLADALREIDGVTSVEVAGPGFVNVHLDRDAALRSLLVEPASSGDGGPEPKTIVEHTNINPNKAAHIGHLRNAVLGDTLVRSMRRLGRRVEVQNYIDDTGVQVADIVVALTELEGLDEASVEAMIDVAARQPPPLDHRLWDLYARVTAWYEEDEARLEHRRRVLHALESGEQPTARIGARVAGHVVACHLRTMERIGVRYDLLPKESDILAHRFWDTAFERLQKSGAVHRVEEGKNAGCWVMRLPHEEEGDSEQEYEKVIVRSNGVVTYVGKDIAYQLWKFGLLGADFEYRPFPLAAYPDGGEVVETAPPGDGVGNLAGFGAGDVVYNVIDVRQSYLQRVVKQGLASLGHTKQADRSIHFAYEMVALSPKTAVEIKPDLLLSDDEKQKSWLDMSGRRGLGVKADDLLDRLESKAAEEVGARHEDLSREEQLGIARQLSIGALRYYMLRYTKNKVVAFDIDDALAFEGETGPYCQYAVVRVRRILDKMSQRFGESPERWRSRALEARFSAVPEEAALEHWRLVQKAAALPETIRAAVDTLELATVAKYAFELAQEINAFYHKHSVLNEPEEAVRLARLGVMLAAERSLLDVLELMGVPVPERM